MRVYLIILLVASGFFCSIAQVRFGQNRQRQAGDFSINYSSPREFEIVAIEVKGVQFLDNSALVSLSGLKVGDKIKIPGDEISGAIKRLWKQGIIGNISIYASKTEGNQIWLTIELAERPRLTSYEFSGLNKNQTSELKEKVELVRGRILTDVVIKNAELTVKKYMQSKGYLNAKVSVRQKQDSVVRNSAVLLIEVDRGKKVKIHDVIIEGNEHYSDVKIRSKMKKTGELPRFKLPSIVLVNTLKMLNPVNLAHFLTHKDKATPQEFRDQVSQYTKINVFKATKYVPEEYKNDKNAVVEFYNSKGYRDAEILFDTVFSDNPKYLTVVLKIDEGNKYYFRDITWNGNFLHEDETLARILGIKKGDTYDLELINKKLNFDPTGVDVSSLYMDDGYLFFNIRPVEIGVQNDSIDIEMRITEGPQATINQVTISGNEKTNDHVVLRELRTIPGQKFSRADLIRTQRELSQLGYFDPQSVNPVPIPDLMNETVDINWQLKEQPSDQIELSGGWGGFIGFVGTLGINFNNFSMRELINFGKFPPMGDGQRLSLRAQANGRQFQSYTFSFTEPWLGGRNRNNFGISLNRSVQRFINFRTDEVSGSLIVSGVTLSLGRQAKWPDDFFVIRNSVSYLKYDLFNYPGRLGFGTGDANSFTLNTTIARSSSDNPMYPRRGSDLSLGVAMTPPYSLWRNIDYETAENADVYKWVEYHKWNFDARFYQTVIGKLVLAPRIHFGFIGSYTDRAGVGPFERFVLGGDGLTGQNFVLGNDVIGLRGYPNPNTQSIGPTSLTPFDADKQILGGTMFTKYVMELRYPVSMAQSATIYVLTFLEGGNSWNDFNKYNPYQLYRSAGMGVRIFMPAFGLLGIDYGYGFDPIPGTNIPSGGQFHFSIGQQIR